MNFFHDLRYALRILRRDWSFALVAIVSLGLGTGANASMFSLVNSMLLRPLPVARSGEVLTIAPKAPADPFEGISYPDYQDYRDRNKTMTDMVASALFRFGFSASLDTPAKAKYGALVSGNLFQAMGIAPVLGRAFHSDEDQVPGRDAVVILGYDFWKDEFGGDPAVIGRSIWLNGLDFTVVGVAPETFTGMDEFFKYGLFVPAMMAPRLTADPHNNLLVNRDWRAFVINGRLKPEVRKAQAETELANIAHALEETYPETNAGRTVVLQDQTQMHMRHLPKEGGFMLMAMVMAGLVLLISCFNVANLLLSRARSREVAVRLAVGAPRSRLVRQLLTESLLLGIGGTFVGLWFGWAAAHLFSRIKVPSDLPFIIDVQADQRMLAFTLTAGLLSVLFFGLAPALQSSRVDLTSALKSADDTGMSGRRRLWGRDIMVVAQISISVVLLVVTLLVYRAFSGQFSGGAGLRTDHLLTMSFDPRLVRYRDDQATEFFRRLAVEAAAAPGVKSVTMTAILPLGITQRGFAIDVGREGYQYSRDKPKDHILYNLVDEHFFETMDIPILRGRGFAESDKDDTPPVVVVNEVLASTYWPAEDPIGKRIEVETDDGKESWLEVVGVARICRYVFMSEPPTSYLYLPLSQHPWRWRTLLAQSYGDAAALTPTIREVIRRLDPNMPTYDVRTMQQYYSEWITGSANNALAIMGSMALTGLVLAMIGLYGLVAYSVSRRTREFGIRMAIGAPSSSVLRMVLREAATLCLIGALIGIIASMSASRALNSLVFVGSSAWQAYLVVPFVLISTTLIATYAPARRAASIDPIKALREE